MANEAIILELNAAADWDGTSLTALKRDDAVVTGRRYYKFNINGPAGVLEADLGGLFSPVSAKLVGVAYSSWSPASKGRVVAPDGAGTFRQEITLKPTVQYVMMFPGDKLAFLTTEDRGPLTLMVNELTEADSVAWGLGHGPFTMPTRFRIIRQAGAAFVPNLGAVWQPAFTYDASSGLMVVTDDGSGMIPASSLCLYPRFQGCYVTLRYAGSAADGHVHIVDNLTRKSRVLHPAGLKDVHWSQVLYVSHDDGIALEATPAVPGEMMVCDLELAIVHPGDRLRGRYAGGI
ncbi:MAG: hypothetical protein KC420_02585 [Myxococcales bacterium]|nr:hypothetical protein [Myxococcales bacterium]